MKFFKDKGEKFFRSEELKLISYLSKSNTVIATGVVSQFLIIIWTNYLRLVLQFI